jgi:hypothetical protein
LTDATSTQQHNHRLACHIWHDPYGTAIATLKVR